MSVEVSFPILSRENPDAEGVLATCLVEEGETVRQDQLIAEVQLDKVSAEIDAPQAGIVRHLAAEGAVVRQGANIAVIE